MRQQLSEVEAVLVNDRARLIRWARRFEPNTAAAEDLVSEVTVRAVERQHLYTPDTSVHAWLYRMMSNLFLNEARTHRHSARHVDITDMEAPPAVAPRQEVILLLKETVKIIKGLPDYARDALVSARLGERDYAEVAEHLGLEMGTVRSRVSRATARVRRAVDGEAA